MGRALARGGRVGLRVIAASPLRGQVAAVSCGLSEGRALLDLDYGEDSGADADANFVLTAPSGGQAAGIVEVQASAERAPFSDVQMDELMRLARLGTAGLHAAQSAVLEAA